jgi:hypothetical protein
MIANRIRTRCVRFGVTVAGLALVTATALGQAPPANPDEEAVERLLLTTAQAFRDKDLPAVRRAFASNFAGPFRLPKLASTTLDQVMGAAQTVTADLTIKETHIEGARALVIGDVTLAFEFGGGAQEVKGPFLFWLGKGAAGWVISAAERVATDWSIAEDSTEVHWPDDGVRFPLVKGWGAFALAGPETHRAVLLVSPDLSGTIGVAVVLLPVPVQLKTITASQHGIATMYPGSRFIDETETTLAGLPAVATRMDLALGADPNLVELIESVMAIKESRLLVLNRSSTPATAGVRFDEEFARVSKGLTVEAVPTAAAGAGATTPPTPAKGFTYPRLGVGFPVPEGWALQELDEATAKKQGWACGAHLRPAEGESYILFGAKELGGPVGLKDLQEAEMKTVAAIAEGVVAQDTKDLKVSGLPARSWSFTLNLGAERRRREVFITRSNVLFFIIADAIPPTAFDTVSKTVDGLLETLSLANP